MTDKNEPKNDVFDEGMLNIESEQPKLPDENTAVTQDESAGFESHQSSPEEMKKSNIFRKWGHVYVSKKKIAIPLTVILLVCAVLAVPPTRYVILGTVVKRDVQLRVIDSKTSIPVSGVEISLHNRTAKTNGEGKVIVRGVRVGKSRLTATKKYYQDSTKDLTVPIAKTTQVVQISLEATGRQVPVHVINKITGKNVIGALVKVSDTEVQTDQNGEATLVLPADRSEESGNVSTKGFNNQSVKISVSQTAIRTNTFALTPTGKVYFLSKQTGKIDVIKTDLDGGNRQTVLAGTGKEEDRGTVLLATRDWKYLALQSRRESDKARLYLIDTSTDKLTEIDSGDATFAPVGWENHLFIYKVTRNNVQTWLPKNEALKTYNADNLQLSTIDETTAEGSSSSDFAGETIDNVYVADNNIIYAKRWQAGYYSIYRLAGKRTAIYTAKPNGTDKQLLKDFDAGATSYISAVTSEPGEIYFSVGNNTTSASSYYTYQAGKITEDKNVNNDNFTKSYPTYLQSPGGQNTFWHEARDGKNTLFIGTADGGNAKQIASLSEYAPYGWYTDDYLLVSKSGSELYILPKDGFNDKDQKLKITDYHKPDVQFLGYGGGYGGQ